MKKTFITLFLLVSLTLQSQAFDFNLFKNDTREIKSILSSQVKYANRLNFNKFISTYTEDYKNADGYNLDIYSKLIQELWQNYNNIKYGVKIKDIQINDGIATVKLIETSFANIPISKNMPGILKSEADSVYYLRKDNGKWKVFSDKVIEENTSMLYGDAVGMDIKLTAPKEVEPNYEYCASLEFIPPKDTFAIASIAKDKVEYPQKQAKEVFRKLPDDNILERLFISNTDNANEYIVASIGLTKADIKDMSIKLSLTGFGYQIIRVNVISKEEKNVQNQ